MSLRKCPVAAVARQELERVLPVDGQAGGEGCSKVVELDGDGLDVLVGRSATAVATRRGDVLGDEALERLLLDAVGADVHGSVSCLLSG